LGLVGVVVVAALVVMNGVIAGTAHHAWNVYIKQTYFAK
jgi:hypothetical protein